jgi:hypothetical protein
MPSLPSKGIASGDVLYGLTLHMLGQLPGSVICDQSEPVTLDLLDFVCNIERNTERSEVFVPATGFIGFRCPHLLSRSGNMIPIDLKNSP